MLVHMKILNKFLLSLILIAGLGTTSFAAEQKSQIENDEFKKIQAKNDEVNFYSGMFDFSDDGKRSTLFGLQHQNEELFRESFLGTLSPITGGMITADNAIYIYTGVQAEYDLGIFKFTPSFAPGFYEEGEGKDLGHPLEFKSEVQLSLNLSDSTMFGMSYNHISNASLADKNPGANSYSFNFLKKF